MSTDAPTDRPLDRRFLIRGGAVLAGAAGATALGAALAPKAEAADGANVVLGAENNASETRTVITIDGQTGGPDPTLVLRNASGPSLALQALPVPFEQRLAVGQIANTVIGPFIGVDYGNGPATTFLATGADIPAPEPISPVRLLDSTLAAGATADLTVSDTGGIDLTGVFLTVTALTPSATGFLEVYTPGNRPGRPQVRYQRSVATVNSAFVAPALNTARTRYLVRVYTSQRCRVLVELSGVVATYLPPLNAGGAGGGVAQRRATRQAKQRERLVKAIENR